MHACQIAGLEVLRLISEPTAASIAYRVTDQGEEDWDNKNILVFDYGGGTLDVSVLAIVDYSMEVCATSGNTFLGGRDFDQKLFELANERLKSDLQIDLTQAGTSPKSQEELRDACENAKKVLDRANEAEIKLEDVNGTGQTWVTTVTLDEFNDAIAEFEEKYIACIE